MSESLAVEGAVRLEGPLGPIDLIGRGGTIEMFLDSFPALSLARRNGEFLGATQRFLSATGLEVGVFARKQKIATLGSRRGSNVAARLLGLGEVRIHPLGCLRAVWAK